MKRSRGEYCISCDKELIKASEDVFCNNDKCYRYGLITAIVGGKKIKNEKKS